jgi:hypothetical protein
MNNETTHLRVRVDQHEQLKAISEATRLPMIWLVTTALEDAIKRWARDGLMEQHKADGINLVYLVKEATE